MSAATTDERPRRSDLIRAMLAASAVAVAIAALAGLDRRRADADLTRFAAEVCQARLPARLMPRIDELFDPERRARLDSELLHRQVDAAIAEPAAIVLYFETDALVWRLPGWREAEPTGGESWPWRLLKWEEAAWNEGCRAHREGAELTVIRTLRTPEQHFVVLVANRRRSTG